MSDSAAIEASTTAPRKRRILGMMGIITAFLGLAVAIFAPLAIDVQRQPPKDLADVLADAAVKIKEKVAKKKAPPKPPKETNWLVVSLIAASALGFIGAALGTASWIRREDLRVSGAAVAIGVTAIGFHYILTAIGLAILMIIIAWVWSYVS